MKKTITLCVVITMLLSLVACKKENNNIQQTEVSTAEKVEVQFEKYSILEVGGYDYYSKAKHNPSINLSTEDVKDISVLKNKVVKINDEEYEVEYNNTSKHYLYASDIDNYKKIVNGNSIEIGINKKSSRIDSYLIINNDYMNTVDTNKVKDKDTCVEIAKKYLSTYIDDAESYIATDAKYVKLSTYDAIYNVKLVRVIDGIETCDQAYIGVSIYGDVMMHLFTSLGEMKNANLPDSNMMLMYKNDVQQRLDSIYNTVQEEYSITYNEPQIRFIRLADGKFAFEYTFDVELQPKDTENVALLELNKILVCFE